MKKMYWRLMLVMVCLLEFMISSSLLAEDIPNVQGNIETALKDFSSLGDEQKKSLLGAAGLPDIGGFNLANFIAWTIFGGIGFIAFVYGKKERNFKPLVIGIVLMAYPYFVANTVVLYAVGIALCAALYFWRD